MPSYYRDPDAPEPNVPRKVGVTALITRGDMVLVERRMDDPDVWAFIGGTLEDNETVHEALHREVREETGFDVSGARLPGVFSDPSRVVAYADGTVCRVLSIAFLVGIVGDAEPRTSEESAGMHFVDRETLGRLAFWPAQLPIRAALLNEPAAPVVA